MSSANLIHSWSECFPSKNSLLETNLHTFSMVARKFVSPVQTRLQQVHGWENQRVVGLQFSILRHKRIVKVDILVYWTKCQISVRAPNGMGPAHPIRWDNLILRNIPWNAIRCGEFLFPIGFSTLHLTEKYSFPPGKISVTLRSQEFDWLVAKSSQNMVQRCIAFKKLDWMACRP
jgi:hypothetical protein